VVVPCHDRLDIQITICEVNRFMVEELTKSIRFMVEDLTKRTMLRHPNERLQEIPYWMGERQKACQAGADGDPECHPLLVAAHQYRCALVY
jgi:hypothetical protein